MSTTETPDGEAPVEVSDPAEGAVAAVTEEAEATGGVTSGDDDDGCSDDGSSGGGGDGGGGDGGGDGGGGDGGGGDGGGDGGGGVGRVGSRDDTAGRGPFAGHAR